LLTLKSSITQEKDMPDSEGRLRETLRQMSKQHVADLRRLEQHNAKLLAQADDLTQRLQLLEEKLQRLSYVLEDASLRRELF